MAVMNGVCYREGERPMVVFPDPVQPSSPPEAVSQSVETGTGSSEDTSYSVTDFVSEGQWLITQRSEGEVLHLPLPPGKGEVLHLHLPPGKGEKTHSSSHSKMCLFCRCVSDEVSDV